MTEVVIVTFPETRKVFVNNLPEGSTGDEVHLQTGQHRFRLGGAKNYTPLSQDVDVVGTTPGNPQIVAFTLLPLAAGVASKTAKKAAKKAAKRAVAKRTSARKTKKAGATRAVVTTSKTAAVERRTAANRTASTSRKAVAARRRPRTPKKR